MGNVKTTIHGIEYNFSCGDGEEEHLQRLCEHVDQRIEELSSTMSHADENELLVFSNILISDELSDSYAEIDTLKKRVQELSSQKLDNTSHALSYITGDTENLRSALENVADRLERLVERLV